MADTSHNSTRNYAFEDDPVVAFSGSSGRERKPNNLPLQLSSFIGREREIARVEELLEDNRLLTLTGPGGSGKTRLALAAASDVAGNAADMSGDGVWLVELASLSDPGFVLQEVASVFGVRETPGAPLMDSLRVHLESRENLLLLDNCEHLVEACADLAATLLRSCPNLRILATSREALGVPGEALFAVPPLSLPDPRRLMAVESLGRYEAAGLFVERARAVRTDFSINEGNAMAVAQICYRLDGIPLAIELAAARVRVLSAEQIVARLDDSFALLTGRERTAIPHHRTLRATMDWSYDLLTDEERALLRRLSVFAGSFTLEAAEAVCDGESLASDEVLESLSNLVDKSLILVAERDGEARYRLLETVRQYGREKLEESEEAEGVRKRHAGFYLALAQEAEPDLRVQGAWLRRLGAEHDNFRTALQWALEPEATAQRAELGLRLAAALGRRRFWAAYGLSEGLGWLERGLARGSTPPEPVRAEALGYAGWIANVQGEYEKAVTLLEENLIVSKELGDKGIVAASLVQLGQLLTMHGGEHERVEALREEAEALRTELSDRRLTAPLLIFLGPAAMDGNDYEQTAVLLGEGLSMFRELGDTYGIALCCGTLGFVALHQGDLVRAAGMFEEALISLRDLRDRVGMLHCLMGAASVICLRGDAARATRLWGAAEALGEAAAVPLLPAINSRYDYEGHVASARSQLGEEAFVAAWAEGRTMTPEQAIEYALERPLLAISQEEEDDAPPALPAGLSAREVEVLKLVAQGMTNAQIARELYISPRTVNAHLGSVYHKIGSSTRAEATRFVVEHELL